MRLRVGIDFHVADGKFQGSRTHVLELFSRVIDICPDVDFYLFADDIKSLKKLDDVFLRKNVTLVHMPRTASINRLLVQLPKLARRFSLDILHTQYIMPLSLRCHGMVTIHDVLFETHPQYFKLFFRLRSRVLMRWSARRAAQVFTVSEFSKQELVRLYGISSCAITVIPNGVDTTRFLFDDAGPDILEKRGLSSKKYILSVGRLEPRKNHLTLIKAYAHLAPVDCPLVIVGQRDFQYREVFSLIEKLGIRENVEILEDVSDEELPYIYRHAKLFVYVPYAEGFGMPPLEAMASGIPTIVSNTTAIPEVVGCAGLSVPPTDVAELTKAMRKVLEDVGLSEDMCRLGLEHVRKFTWEHSAMRVRDQYLRYRQCH